MKELSSRSRSDIATYAFYWGETRLSVLGYGLASYGFAKRLLGVKKCHQGDERIVEMSTALQQRQMKVYPLCYFIFLLLVLASASAQEGPLASCGKPQRTFVPYKDDKEVTLDLCVSHTFSILGEEKEVTVFYTTTNGSPKDQLEDIVNADGDTLSPEDIAEIVFGWTRDVWKLFREYGFTDPYGNKDAFGVLICDLRHTNVGGVCCKNDDAYEFDATLLLNGLEDDPRDAQVVAIHEMFHAVNAHLIRANALDWMVEGTAAWSEDIYNLAIDNHIGWNSLLKNGVEDFFYGEFRLTLGELQYSAAVFWTYYCEQVGTIRDEVGTGVDAMVDLMSVDPDKTWDTLINAVRLSGWKYEEFFVNWGTANYAHSLLGNPLPDKFRYIDSEQLLRATEISYPRVALEVDADLAKQSPSGSTTIRPSSHRYYRVRPEKLVPYISLVFQQVTSNIMGFTVLFIRENTLVQYSDPIFDRDLAWIVANDEGYDEVVVIVTAWKGIEFQFEIKGVVSPALDILEPSVRTFVGTPTSPGKFLLRIKIHDSGVPFVGLDKLDFAIRVGSRKVQADDIMVFTYIKGDYWMVIHAPDQEPDQVGVSMDLTVSYVYQPFTAVKQAMIIYSERKASDTVLTIDTSGSMNRRGKLDAAKDAGRLYVDLFQSGDQVGVVRFARYAKTIVEMDDQTVVRDTALAAIEGLKASGETSIGFALGKAFEQFYERGIYEHEWAVILLSDGQNTAPPDMSSFMSRYEERDAGGDDCNAENLTGCLPVIHAVATGNDSNRGDLQRLAELSGGTYQFVSEDYLNESSRRVLGIRSMQDQGSCESDLTVNLAEVYRIVSEKISDSYQVYSSRGTLPHDSDEPARHDIIIDGSVDEAVFVVFWSRDDDWGTYVSAKLLDPSGNNVGVATVRDIRRHEVWRITDPVAGTWKMELKESPSTRKLGEQRLVQGSRPCYLVEASVSSELSLSTFVTVEKPGLPGVAVQLQAILASNGGTLPNQNVLVRIFSPVAGDEPSELTFITLMDDGKHGDGDADDGIYGGVFRATSRAGSYQVFYDASGKSGTFGEFERSDRGAFVIEEDADIDLDKIPNWVETFTPGLNPNDPTDALKDNDLDGLTNLDEFLLGTDPNNPDTDNGGATDGSEVLTGLDPFDPTDDPVPCLAYFHATNTYYRCSSAKASILHFAPNPAFDRYRLWRSLSAEGPWSVLEDSIEPTGIYWDKKVELGITYYYKIAGIKESGDHEIVSCILGPSATTPLEETYCAVDVIINGGSETAESNTVQITFDVIWAVTEMKISNRPFLNDVAWIPFEQPYAWHLEPENGVGTVFVKLRTVQGETELSVGRISVIPSAQSSHCVPITVDFDTLPDGSPLVGGSYVENEWLDAYGISLFASGGAGSLPRLFDTSNPVNRAQSGGDPDLGSPNKRCSPSGPGVGGGGEPDMEGANCLPQGNVLIVQERNGGEQAQPDDNRQGGSIFIDFVTVASSVIDVGLMDIDEAGSQISVHDDDGKETVFDVKALGENSVQTVTIDKTKVRRLEVKLGGSGAVTFVSFCSNLASLSVTKTATPTEVREPGESVSFAVKVTNTGDIPITVDSIADTLYGDLTTKGCPLPVVPLQTSQTYECTFTAEVTGVAGEEVSSQVAVSGTVEDGRVFFGIDDATVGIISGAGISVGATTSPFFTVVQPGGYVTFDIVVVNTSTDNSWVTLKRLHHSLYGDLGCLLPLKIQPQSRYDCEFRVHVKGMAGDRVGGVITASGTSDRGVTVSDKTTEYIHIVLFFD